MNDTLKTLRKAVAARGTSDVERTPDDPLPCRVAPAVAASASIDPLAQTNDGQAPDGVQISLFGSPHAARAASEQERGPTGDGLDPRTAALMAAYDSGTWPEPAAPGPASETDHTPLPAHTESVRNTGKSSSITDGHRARLRARFQNGEALADYELLELLLFRSLPRRDTKPIAKALIAEFGSFVGAVGASAERLSGIDGFGPAAVTDFRLVRAAAERFAYDDLTKRPVLGSTDAVVQYYRTRLRTEAREEFHALFVDKRNRFLASERLGVGTVDHTPVYPRELMRRAIALSASAVILVHNHPSGDPAPSRADVAMTQKIVEAASALGIVVHDHLIVAEDGYTSLRGERLI